MEHCSSRLSILESEEFSCVAAMLAKFCFIAKRAFMRLERTEEEPVIDKFIRALFKHKTPLFDLIN